MTGDNLIARIDELTREVTELERSYTAMQQELNALGQYCIRKQGALEELRSLAAPESAGD